MGRDTPVQVTHRATIQHRRTGEHVSWHARCTCGRYTRFDTLTSAEQWATTHGDTVTEQPAPTPATDGAISAHRLACDRVADANLVRHMVAQAAAVELLRERYRIGLERYGTVLHADNGRDHWRDLLEELADAAAYIECLVARDEIGVDWARDLSRLFVGIVNEHAHREAS